MIKGISSKIYSISVPLTCDEVNEAIKYIKDSIDEHCRIYPGTPFSVRILFGGLKRDWTDTPLQRIYNHYTDKGKSREKAARAAAIDVAKLMKKILTESLDTYEYAGKDSGNKFVHINTVKNEWR